MTPIFEKFQKPHCIEFYNAYDSIRKNIDFHWDFFLFIRDKFLRLPSTEDADKHTMNAFIKFIRTRIYSTHTTLLPQEAIDQRREMYLKIFDFCLIVSAKS